DFQTAHEVEALTIDQMMPVIAQLDLARAAMLMRGAKQPVTGAFAMLGREPTIVHVDAVEDDKTDDPTVTKQPAKSHQQHFYLNDLEYAITSQGAANKPPLEVNVTATYSFGTVSNLIPPGLTNPVEGGPSGLVFSGEVGLRFRNRLSAGLHLSIGALG